MVLTLAAHAKLNLALAVGAPRPPRNYHRIRSWFVPIDLHDTVTIERLADGRPSAHEIRFAEDAPRPGPVDWPVEVDLAVRAHRLLESHVRRDLPATIRIDKRIPAGGGLGGGSSDAAAVLIGLRRLFRLDLDPRGLRELSTVLGSDVAFFIDDAMADEGGGSELASVSLPSPAVVSGFGETIERVGRIAASAVLVFPPVVCPTAGVYAAFDRLLAEDRIEPTPEDWVDRLVDEAAATGSIPDEELFNDLTHAAVEAHPELGDLLERLDSAAARHQARVHLTGSGSTIFSIIGARTDGEALMRSLKEASPQSVVARARIV